MTNAELDTLWSRAEQFSGGFTRYRFAALVAAAEREACARLVERDDSMRWSGAADAIRARGQQRPEPTYPSDPIWREQKRLEMEAWARNKLARHGIQIPEDEDGNPSF